MYRITNLAPKVWVVEKQICSRIRFFRREVWQEIGRHKTQDLAIAQITKLAEFEPVTSYYDKHGRTLYGEVAW